MSFRIRFQNDEKQEYRGKNEPKVRKKKYWQSINSVKDVDFNMTSNKVADRMKK